MKYQADCFVRWVIVALIVLCAGAWIIQLIFN